MNKTLCGIICGMLLFTEGAAAQTAFFEWQGGSWAVNGVIDDTTMCAATTFWEDGSYVSIVHSVGGTDLKMIVTNTDWNITSPMGTNINVTAHFDSESMNGFAMVYDSKTVVMPNLSFDFVESWALNYTMELDFPGSISDIGMSLDGTELAIEQFTKCVKIMNGGSA